MSMLVNPFGSFGGAAPATDPDYASVVMLLHCDEGSGGGPVDQTGRHTLTGTGAAGSTVEKKFGVSSCIFTGTASLVAPSSADFAFPGDFAIDIQARPDTDGAQCLMDTRPISTNGAYLTWSCGGSGVLTLFDGLLSSVIITTASGVLVGAQWNGLRIARTGTTVRMFNEGIIVGTATGISTSYLTSRFCLGLSAFGTSPYAGYMDDIRVTNGAGRETANYTAQAAAWPNS